jgi:ribose transport system ATP-binding protein
MAESAIVLDNVTKNFPGQTALDAVDLTLRTGEIHALLGQNGSGKSTLIKVLAGFHQPDPGATATCDGEPLELGSADAARTAQIRFIHQDLALVAQLNAVDNLALGGAYTGKWWISDRKERAAARVLLEELGIDIDVDAPVSELEAAERTMLAIARAMRDGVDSCQLLVLDEPTVSLAAPEVAQLFQLLRRLRDRGKTVLYVTHRLDEVFDIADRVTVLRDGRRVTTREIDDLDHNSLIELIVGRELGELYPVLPPVNDEVVLSVDSLRGDVVESVSFDVHGGEIVGIAGLVGSGREELPYLLYGARPWAGGEMAVGGRTYRRLSPTQAIQAGLGFVSSDRKSESALPLMSVRENLTLPDIPVARGSRWLSVRSERSIVRPLVGEVGIVPADPERPLASFSGGNQQKAVIARWLRLAPKVLIVDEPTQGVDVGAKAMLYASIANMAKAGCAVVLFSSDSEELAALCDRVMVMRGGRIEESIGRASLSAAAIDHLILKSEVSKSSEALHE